MYINRYTITPIANTSTFSLICYLEYKSINSGALYYGVVFAYISFSNLHLIDAFLINVSGLLYNSVVHEPKSQILTRLFMINIFSNLVSLLIT